MVYKITLGLHIVSGFLALLCGCISVISKKGGKFHRFAGKIFFLNLLGVCFTSVYISILKQNQFLLMIGLFSFYLNYFGYRAIKNKSLKLGNLDALILLMAFVNAFFMLYSRNVVLVVFGGICFYTISKNLQNAIKIFRNKPLPNGAWLRMHIGMMMGAFIATATAFLVVNVNNLPLGIPTWFGWFIPAIVLLPVSFYYSRKYAGKSLTKAALDSE